MYFSTRRLLATQILASVGIQTSSGKRAEARVKDLLHPMDALAFRRCCSEVIIGHHI